MKFKWPLAACCCRYYFMFHYCKRTCGASGPYIHMLMRGSERWDIRPTMAKGNRFQTVRCLSCDSEASECDCSRSKIRLSDNSFNCPLERGVLTSTSGSAPCRIRNVMMIVLPVTLWFPGGLTERCHDLKILSTYWSRFYLSFIGVLTTVGLPETDASLTSWITLSVHVCWNQILNIGPVVEQKCCIIIIPMIIFMLLV